MNHGTSKVIMTLAAILFTVSATFAQQETSRDEEPSIVEKIEQGSNGDITIDMSDEMLELIMTEPDVHKNTGKSHQTGVNKGSGWRIQVFSDGRNQHSLESRAKARGNAIVAKFPKYRGQIYTFSKSPNWYTRVGNFRTAAEANSALAELKRAFPAFANEMRAVKSQIVTIGK